VINNLEFVFRVVHTEKAKFIVSIVDELREYVSTMLSNMLGYNSIVFVWAQNDDTELYQAHHCKQKYECVCDSSFVPKGLVNENMFRMCERSIF